MKKYDKEAALDYIVATESVTLGALQKELQMSRADAEKLVWDLAKEGFVTQSVGFVFRPTAEARQAQTEKKKVEKKKARNNDEEQDTIKKKSLFDDEDEDEFDFDQWWDEVVARREEEDDD